jgi:F0F1-type ATP synthase assembly protein I
VHGGYGCAEVFISMMHEFLFGMRRLVGAQSALAISVASVWFYFYGFTSSYSAVLGGVSWIVPNFYFMSRWLTIRKDRNFSPECLVKRFYGYEFLKLLMSAVLIVFCQKFAAILSWPFLSAYIGVILVGLVVPYDNRSS